MYLNIFIDFINKDVWDEYIWVKGHCETTISVDKVHNVT